MEYRNLGRKQLNFSAVGLGAWAFNSSVYGPVDKSVTLKFIDAAHEMGINFFDTAPLYRTGKEDDIAEFIIGKWV